MLEVKNLKLKYENKVVFNDFDLEVNNGEIIVITGDSGSGKSSFLKLLNGIIKEFVDASVSGEILFNKENILNQDITKRSKYISTVFQNPKTQFYCINTTDEIAFGLENRNVESSEIKKTIKEYSNKLHVEKLMDRDIFKLSGGEKQFIAITACACLDNDIYLFDEPSSSLDEKSIIWLKKTILKLKQLGKIVIIAEHRMHFLKDIFDKLVLIENSTSKVYNRQTLEEIGYENFSKLHNLRSFFKANLENVETINILDGKMHNYGKEILCKNYVINYGNKKISDFSLNLSSGVTFITGENGVGKSSIIRKMAGLLKSHGESYYRNDKITKSYKYISFVMQDVNYQIFTDSVWSEISIVSDDEDKKNKVLKELGLYSKKDFHPQILSGGEKQRLMIAQARVSDKPIVIFDEPTSGLDKKQMLKIAEYLKEMTAEGKTIIVITHDYELINYCEGRTIKFIK